MPTDRQDGKPDNPWRWIAVDVDPDVQRCRQLTGTGSRGRAGAATRFGIWCCTAGRGTLEVLGQTRAMSPGQTLLLPAGVPARLVSDERKPWEAVRVEFDLLVFGKPILHAARYVNPTELTLELPSVPGLCLFAETDTLAAAERLVRAPRRYADHDTVLLELALGVWRLVHLLRFFFIKLRRLEPTQRPLMQTAAVYIYEHSKRPDLRLAEIARHVDVSVPTLTRQFRAYFGTSVKQFIIQQRLRTACRLLRNPDFRVHEVAAWAGFRSAAQFCSSFRAQHGMTPGAYRRDHLGPDGAPLDLQE